MARARDVEVVCDEPFEQAAARVVAARAGEVLEHEDGLLDLERVERVHDMRVATRRLRAALEVFEPCFRPSRHRRALKSVKALADALGARRDLDVQIEFLGRFLEAVDPGDREAVAGMIESMRAERAGANDELAAYLDGGRRLAKLRRRIGKLRSGKIG